MTPRRARITLKDREPTTTVTLYVYDELGRWIGNATGTLTIIAGAGGLEAVLGDIDVPATYQTHLGPRASHSFALHPEGHERHQKVPLP